MANGKLSHDWFDRPLPTNVSLGDRTWLYSSFAFLHCQSQQPQALVVGRDTGLYHGTFFDLGPEGQVRIGDFCSVVGAIFCTNGDVVIGDYVFISHEVVLADKELSVPPDAVAMIAKAHDGRQQEIVIEDDVWIGAQAMILGNVTIGTAVVIGAAAVVDQDVPPYAIFAGNPGRIVGSVKRFKP